MLPTTYYVNQKSPPNQRVTSFDIIWPRGQHKKWTCLADMHIWSHLYSSRPALNSSFHCLCEVVSSFGKMVTAMCRSGLTWPWHFISAFFLSNGCMAQRGRCPGGRPSVSANKRIRCILFCSKVATVQAIYEHRIRSAVSQRVPLSVLASPIASSK